MSGTRRMKIGLAGPFPVFPSDSPSGVPEVVRLLARSLSSLDEIELHVVTTSRLAQKELMLTEGMLSLHVLPSSRTRRIATFLLDDILAIRGKLTELDVDLVHSQGLPEFIWAGVLSGKAHLCTVHGIWRAEVIYADTLKAQVHQRLRTLMERMYSGRIHDLVVISPYVIQALPTLSKSRQYRISNPVDDRYFSVTGHGVPGRVLFVGKICKLKGIDTLLRAFAQARVNVPHAELHVVGPSDLDGEYLARITELAASLRVEDSVKFTGPLTGDRLYTEYEEAGVFCLPSYQETAPMAIAQAMAANRPVVGTNVGGIPSMVTDRETGLLCPAGDHNLLSRLLTTILTDTPLADRLATAARNVADREYRSESVARKTMLVYSKLLGKSSTE